MPHRNRAIVFNLDNTLYPVRHFHLSAFRAVAAHLRRIRGIDPSLSLWFLTRMHDSGDRGREFQALIHEWKLPESLLPTLIDLARHHVPAVALPVVSTRVLAKLQLEWKLGILTNGPEDIQRRKVEALVLPPLVDAVVYANAHGTGAGKPDPAAFQEVLRQLDVPASRAIFVGDDEVADIGGARAAGLRAVRLTAWTGPCRQSAADVVIASLTEILTVAGSLVREAPVSHVA